MAYSLMVLDGKTQRTKQTVHLLKRCQKYYLLRYLFYMYQQVQELKNLKIPPTVLMDHLWHRAINIQQELIVITSF